MSQPNLPPANALTDSTQPLSGSSFVVGPATDRSFVERRLEGQAKRQSERRQFGSSHSGLSDDGIELAFAIDQYKVQHHRRYLTCDELLTVIQSLGYSR